MISDPQGTVLAFFLVFCRIGTCVMILPGFSSARLSPQIRLFVALTLSLAVLPILWDTVYPKTTTSNDTYVGLIFSELMIGLMYGLMARLYTLGLQFLGTVISMMIGFTSPGGPDILEDSSETTITSLISFCALMMLFIMDFHHYVFHALIDSYQVVPFGGHMEVRATLISVTDTLEATTMIMLRLSSPFILYAIMFQVSIGFINKMAPQVPVYFISTPYLLMGGLFMLYLCLGEIVMQFSDAFLSVYNGH